MDGSKICEKTVKCPIYTGLLASNQLLIQTFKHLYCENGEAARAKCKRYQVALKVGACPPDILPNSTLSVDDIIKRMEKKE
jgi:hypothetical protein